MRALLPSLGLVLVLLACGGSTSPNVTTGDGGTTTITGTPCSVEGVTGTFPGVKISIRSDKCRYAVGEPAKFTYVVTTDSSAPPIVTAASMSCGSCRAFTDDPMAFTGYVISGTAPDGKTQQYCVCDTGCCAPDQAGSIKLTPATKTGVIEWSGRNWYGPSDTGNKEGAFFPPGSYGVHVSFGGGTGSVSATLPIEIVP